MASELIKIIGIFLGAFGIGIFFWGMLFKVDYLKKFPILMLYYTAASIFVCFMYFEDMSEYFSGIPWLTAILPLLVIILSVLNIPIIDKYLPIPKSFQKKHENAFLLNMNYKMAFTKFADVVFQDLALLIVVSVLITGGVEVNEISKLFLIFFPIAHMPLMLIHKGSMALYYVVLAAASFLVPFIVMYIDYGIIYVMVLHWLTYMLGRFSFGIYFKYFVKSKKALSHNY